MAAYNVQVTTIYRVQAPDEGTAVQASWYGNAANQIQSPYVISTLLTSGDIVPSQGASADA